MGESKPTLECPCCKLIERGQEMLRSDRLRDFEKKVLLRVRRLVDNCLARLEPKT